ncbi:sugar ABC transporter ATP-binding protein [Sutcliffiella horikoshii]|uniref:Sugar ABC transporter ATP-binding protein n=1 Tax=Sutcliffiella horikoshii TaxID=79883 RepID=A0A5D4SYS3_9BACI|nr:sugar ABC transporter ATP-binding protein [Sutcliffiella horikoshii]TYS68109.1 sugar ABC transporter ATP-binding protein [Sutcliffiella horikoshii]
MTNITLEMKDISIEFPGVKALDQVTFTAKPGSVHALIGANGAGKSTLMKVLAGAYDHFSGEIKLGGKGLSISKPTDSQKAGVQIVYQEVDAALIPTLTVAENIMLQETVQKTGNKQWIRWREIHKKAETHLKKMDSNILTKRLVNTLTLAEKQMVLLARAISTDCKFLILDEPTAPLSNRETEKLFSVIKRLKEEGVGIIFISHRIPEIVGICDEITIMRNGKVVKRDLVVNLTPDKIVEWMLGQKLEQQFPVPNPTFGATIIEVEGLSDHSMVKDVSLHVKAGEVVGIAGLVGAGKTELCKALFGDAPTTTGTIRIKGETVKVKSPHVAVQNGLAFVPEERRKEGLILHESVQTNLISANLHAFTKALHFLNKKAQKTKSQEIIEALQIKTPSPDTSVHTLSGGNQQKIAIGKWLVSDADIYIFDEPTKGVDVGAKRDIFELITALAKRGKAILYASSELSEIVGLTNRVYVLYDGKITKELSTAETDEQELLYLSTGGQSNEN